MMNNELLTLYILIFSTGLMLAAASFAILKFQRKTLESESCWNSPTGSAIQVDDAGLAKIRENQLESRIAELQRLIDGLSQRDRDAQLLPAVRELPFENAARMAKQGASIDELTRACGLSIGEAQLVRRMHGRPAT
jgi:hypothetical protein